MKLLLKWLMISSLALFLVGCGDKTVLYSGLAESDANDIIAELNQHQIAAQKLIEKAGISVSVDAENIERSVKILDSAGLPHKARTNLGEVFQKSGVISSPMEERARYIYALSQEVESYSLLPPRCLSNTITPWIRTALSRASARWFPPAFRAWRAKAIRI